MIDSLLKILNPQILYQLSPNPSTQINKVTIKENSADSKIRTLEIQNLPQHDKVIVFTLDFSPLGSDKHKVCYQQPSLYLNRSNQNGINKSCDVVVVYAASDTWKVILIDLKSDEINETKTKLQLDNSELFLRYIFSLVDFHYDVDVPNSSFKKIILTTNYRNCAKLPTYGPNSDNTGKPRIVSVSVNQHKKGDIDFSILKGKS